jgi:hypothetical protein
MHKPFKGSFTCDGSTDFIGEELENIYVRTCQKGKIEDTFIAIGSPESSCSKAIHDFIIDCFQRLNLDVLRCPVLGLI